MLKVIRIAALGIMIAGVSLSCSGCALLALPGQIIGGTFDLLGKALNVAAAMPKPPPGVFF